MPIVRFNGTEEEHRLIIKIATRYVGIMRGRLTGIQDVIMDLMATHCNGNPLDLHGLLDANDMDLTHDVGGIRRYLDRRTGKLVDCFVPRYTLSKGKEKKHEGN